jgi:hypothetical protein
LHSNNLPGSLSITPPLIKKVVSRLVLKEIFAHTMFGDISCLKRIVEN